MKSKSLKNKFNKIAEKYIKTFCKRLELDFEFWVGDEVGGIAFICDYYFNYSDIRYAVDNEISFDYMSDWYYFIVEYGKKCYYNLDAYCRLRRDAEQNEYFELKEFEKKLIFWRLKET